MSKWGDVRGVVIHHTVHARPSDHGSCLSIASSLPRNTHNDDGRKDVAYNEVWCPHGIRVAGRGFASTNDANGCARANSTFYAIAVIDTNPKPSDWEDTLRARIKAVRERWPGATKVVSHRDVAWHVDGCDVATACPGDRMAEWCRNYQDEEDDDMAQFTEEQARFLRVFANALIQENIAGYRPVGATIKFEQHVANHPSGGRHTHTVRVEEAG